MSAPATSNDPYSIARSVAVATPKAVGWSSDGNHPMSHDAALTERQFQFLLSCGVIRSDAEVDNADRRESLS